MKRWIALILCLCLFVSAVPTAAAARDLTFAESLAQDLKTLGLFRGVSETDFALDRAPTRTEALVMLIRVLGKEQEALNGTWAHPFTDVAAWADKYVGYAYENGLTKGISDTLFGTNDATCAQYVTFVLRALGYDDAAGDFRWDDPYELAWTCNILPGIVAHEPFLRADVVIVSYAALPAFLKNSTQTLAQKLIAAGVFTQAQYGGTYRPTVIEEASRPKQLTAEQVYAQCSPAVFYIEVYDASGNGLGTGSGFFISSDGVAVTNYHVIEGATSAKITTSDTGTVYNVSGVWDYDQKQDWAVIQVPGSGFTALNMVDVESVTGGQTVYAIGSPLGLQNSITQGIISNVNRVENGVRFLQTSAAISPGSSGGALINEFGHVVGITSASYVKGQNLNLALPVSVVHGFSRQTLHPLAAVSGAQTQTPAEPTPSLASQAATYQAATAWLDANYIFKFLEKYPAIGMSNTTSSGLEWDVVIYHDTEENTLTANTIFRQTNGVELSAYLNLTADGKIFDTRIFIYAPGAVTWTFFGAGAVDPTVFGTGTERAPLTYHEGSDDLKGSAEEALYTMTDLALYTIELLLTEKVSTNGEYSIDCFGFVHVE